jgi:hypothetical protein
MTGLENFLDEIKLRLRNPFVASFIISWLFWNWEIWLGLFCLSDETLRHIGFTNYIDYVKFKLQTGNALVNPLLSALALILILPIIRNTVEWYQAWALNWGEKMVLRASENGVIAIEKYLEKKESINNLKNNITTLVTEERQTSEQLIYANNEVTRLNASANEDKRSPIAINTSRTACKNPFRASQTSFKNLLNSFLAPPNIKTIKTILLIINANSFGMFLTSCTLPLITELKRVTTPLIMNINAFQTKVTMSARIFHTINARSK